jgi:hypothetical protein
VHSVLRQTQSQNNKKDFKLFWVDFLNIPRGKLKKTEEQHKDLGGVVTANSQHNQLRIHQATAEVATLLIPLLQPGADLFFFFVSSALPPRAPINLPTFLVGDP